MHTLVGILLAPWQNMFETAQGVFNGIKKIVSGIVQIIKSAVNGDIKGVLNGFKTIFKGFCDVIWSIAKAPINLIIKGLNALISGINKIKFDVPDWVPGIGRSKMGL